MGKSDGGANTGDSGRADISILIVDDHEVIRDGLKIMLAGTEMKIVGEARDGNEAVDQARKLKPDLILMDVRMPDMDGLAATKMIKEETPSVAVIMVTTYESKDYLRSAVEAGAAGYMLKGMSREALINGIRLVMEGGSFVDGQLLREFMSEFSSRAVRKGAAGALDGLSPREREVLGLLARGLTNKEIAREIGYSVGTVKNVVQRVIEKLGVSDRTQAAVQAVYSGLAVD